MSKPHVLLLKPYCKHQIVHGSPAAMMYVLLKQYLPLQANLLIKPNSYEGGIQQLWLEHAAFSKVILLLLINKMWKRKSEVKVSKYSWSSVVFWYTAGDCRSHPDFANAKAFPWGFFLSEMVGELWYFVEIWPIVYLLLVYGKTQFSLTETHSDISKYLWTYWFPGTFLF